VGQAGRARFERFGPLGGSRRSDRETAPVQWLEPMPFAYYQRLSPRDRAIYRRSDAVRSLTLPRPALLHPAVDRLREALSTERRADVETACNELALGLCRELDLPPLRVEVLAVRPSHDWGELHGLYTRTAGRAPHVQLWMRTAHHRRLVAFRTFLRTLLHELGHHVDYELLGLADSFHTEGFFKRESSLFHQLVPEAKAENAAGASE
jgi:hypothetical protein